MSESYLRRLIRGSKKMESKLTTKESLVNGVELVHLDDIDLMPQDHNVLSRAVEDMTSRLERLRGVEQSLEISIREMQEELRQTRIVIEATATSLTTMKLLDNEGKYTLPDPKSQLKTAS